MLRHVTAPACAFAQIPNVILRHPRLSSDAKNLLNWQLSLPADDAQCLSETARKAGIKKCAFQNAKRQLLDEGYLHQWRVRKDGGRFATVQLVSNTPLSAKEALAVRDGLRPAPGGARFSERVHKDGPPSAAQPTPGEPTGPAVGRLPKKNTGENTTQPTGPAPEPAGGPPESSTARHRRPTGHRTERGASSRRTSPRRGTRTRHARRRGGAAALPRPDRPPTRHAGPYSSALGAARGEVAGERPATAAHPPGAHRGPVQRPQTPRRAALAPSARPSRRATATAAGARRPGAGATRRPHARVRHPPRPAAPLHPATRQRREAVPGMPHHR